MTVKKYETGKRKSEKNPNGPTYIECPHLCHVLPTVWDEVNELLRVRNSKMGRKRVNGNDPRAMMPRKRTVWPAQHTVCGICGSLMYRGGHGKKDRMMCSGSRGYTCWNGATFDAVTAGPKLIQGFLKVIEGIPDYDAQFFHQVQMAHEEANTGRVTKLQQLDLQINDVTKKLKNLTDAIGRMGHSTSLAENHAETESALRQLEATRNRILAEPHELPDLPPIEGLKSRARTMVGLDFTNPDLHQAMHQLMPRIVVFPCRPLDGGQVVLRARVEINLAGALGSTSSLLGDQLKRTIWVDLFEPPERISRMQEVLQLREQGHTEREVATMLGITITAAQNCASFHRLMLSLNTQDPYIFLNSPPNDDGRLRKHDHPRYLFTPQDGYPNLPK